MAQTAGLVLTLQRPWKAGTICGYPGIEPKFEASHEYLQVDVSSLRQVIEAAQGMDAIINCSVVRYDRQLAFDVNLQGCYSVMAAAVHHGIKRVINTGPHFAIAGATYEDFDFC